MKLVDRNVYMCWTNNGGASFIILLVKPACFNLRENAALDTDHKQSKQAGMSIIYSFIETND